MLDFLGLLYGYSLGLLYGNPLFLTKVRAWPCLACAIPTYNRCIKTVPGKSIQSSELNWLVGSNNRISDGNVIHA